MHMCVCFWAGGWGPWLPRHTCEASPRSRPPPNNCSGKWLLSAASTAHAAPGLCHSPMSRTTRSSCNATSDPLAIYSSNWFIQAPGGGRVMAFARAPGPSGCSRRRCGGCGSGGAAAAASWRVPGLPKRPANGAGCSSAVGALLSSCRRSVLGTIRLAGGRCCAGLAVTGHRSTRPTRRQAHSRVQRPGRPPAITPHGPRAACEAGLGPHSVAGPQPCSGRPPHPCAQLPVCPRFTNSWRAWLQCLQGNDAWCRCSVEMPGRQALASAQEQAEGALLLASNKPCLT